jgi:hypothetical protein
VPLGYLIVWLICAVACGLEVVMAGWPGVPQDRLPAGPPKENPLRGYRRIHGELAKLGDSFQFCKIGSLAPG